MSTKRLAPVITKPLSFARVNLPDMHMLIMYTINHQYVQRASGIARGRPIVFGWPDYVVDFSNILRELTSGLSR